MPEDAQNRSTAWTSTQAYVLAVICLFSGIVVGYLLRGSSPTQAAVPVPPGAPQPTAQGAAGAPVTSVQLKQMADKQAEPLLNELKNKPTDAKLLAQVGNIYYDAQQFNDAIVFYSRSLQSAPKNADVRTDLATALWYMGDADHALAEFDQVLKQEPKKSNALFNRGVVKWQAKMDVKGAVSDWETLLKVDPNYPQRPKVEELIAQVKKHSNIIKPGDKTAKPTS